MTKQLFFLSIASVMILLGESRTANREYTLFTARRTTWNHAAEICLAAGSQLITIDNLNIYDALLDLSGQPPWKDMWRDNFWTGLHNYDDSTSVDNFVWFDCKPLSNYTLWSDSNHPNSEKCVRGKQDLTKGRNWETRNCYTGDNLVLCEKIQGDCQFYHFPNHSEVSNDSLSTADRDCFNQCANQEEKLECWGVEVWQNSTSTHCKMYLGNSYQAVFKFMKDNITSLVPSYVKFCFQAKLNETSFSVKYDTSAEHSEPWMSGCFHETTTETPTPEMFTTDINTSPETPTATAVERQTSPSSKALSSTDGYLAVTDDEPPCMCPCESESNLTMEEKKKFIDKLISDLTVNKSNISSIKRKFYSVNDPRPSAQRVGVIGIVLLSVVFGSLVLMDFQGVVEFLMRLKHRKFQEKGKSTPEVNRQ